MNRLKIMNAHRHNSIIQFTEKPEQLKQRINNGQLVILKNCFDSASLTTLKIKVQSWGEENPLFPANQSASIPKINFHRIDEQNNRSKLPHVFHQYGFGDIDALESNFRSVLLHVAEPLMTLQNTIADTDYHLSDPEVRLKFLHYPRGGGYLANHTHPLKPQKVGLIVSLSEWNIDYTEGGNFFSTGGEEAIYSSPHHNIGDTLLFRYDIPHEIKTVNPNETLNWNLISGKWSLVLELLSTNAKSEIM